MRAVGLRQLGIGRNIVPWLFGECVERCMVGKQVDMPGELPAGVLRGAFGPIPEKSGIFFGGLLAIISVAVKIRRGNSKAAKF